MSESRFYAFEEAYPVEEGLYDVLLDGENGIVAEVLKKASDGFVDAFDQQVINEPYAWRKHLCNEVNCICKLYKDGKENV